MAQIRIEGYEVQNGLGHLYLVFVSDFGLEEIIRGGPVNETGNFLVDSIERFYGTIIVEAGMPMGESADARPIEDRFVFGSTVLDLRGRNANDVWGTLTSVAGQAGASAIA